MRGLKFGDCQNFIDYNIKTGVDDHHHDDLTNTILQHDIIVDANSEKTNDDYNDQIIVNDNNKD